ncbi:hypothetical protein D3C84_742730 [compost metagenome]
MHALSYYRHLEVITENSDNELVVCGINLSLSDTDIRHRNCRRRMVQYHADSLNGHAAPVHYPTTGFTHAVCAKLNAKFITNSFECCCNRHTRHRLTLRSVAFHFKQVRVVRVCSTTFLDDLYSLRVQRNVAHLPGFAFLDNDATLQGVIVGDRQ